MIEARQVREIKAVAKAFQIDRTFRDGVDWLARNTNNAEISDAVRLLGVLTDTPDEWVLQAVGRRQDELASDPAYLPGYGMLEADGTPTICKGRR